MYGLNLRLQRPWRHEFRHKDNALLPFHGGLPGVVKTDNVWMLQALQHVHLFTETLPFHFRQPSCLSKRHVFQVNLWVRRFMLVHDRTYSMVTCGTGLCQLKLNHIQVQSDFSGEYKTTFINQPSGLDLKNYNTKLLFFAIESLSFKIVLF